MKFKEFEKLYWKTLVEEGNKIYKAFVMLVKSIFKRKVRK